MYFLSPLPELKTDLFERHYSYECTSGAQERPYVPRPSRTQQLLNPKLVPKLTSDVPNDLLRK
jgi:Zinc knuckle